MTNPVLVEVTRGHIVESVHRGAVAVFDADGVEVTAIGDIDKPEERKDLIERSPKTHLHNMKAPMLVIQGRNDPRVVAAESEDLVRALKKKGKSIELLVFENEGHDVLKYENRVTCYNAITDFFAKHLKP